MAREEMKELEKIRIPLEWHYPDDLITRYSNNMLVQHGENEFFLSFFEIRPPILVGSEEERRQQLANTESIRAECVARLTVSPDTLENFIEALQANLDRYRDKHQEEE